MKRLAWALLLALPGAAAEDWCGPSALAATRDGKTIYIGCGVARRVEVFDTARREVVRRIATPGPVSGLVLSADEARVYATCPGPHSTVIAIERGAAAGRGIPAGHTAGAPVLSPDGATLFVANRFNNDVAVIDLKSGRTATRVPATREPVGAALASDGTLLVANSLPAGRADQPPVAAEVTLIDTRARKAAGRIELPNGSTCTHEIRTSPDGRTAAVAHLVGRYFLPTTQLDRGWMQTNAISLIDVPGRKLLATVLLDEIDRGAANPWAVEWTADGRYLCVTHAGTHELSVIDYLALSARLANPKRNPADDLSLLLGIRRRIPLSGNGPRAMTIAGRQAWVASYFSDSLEAVDLDGGSVTAGFGPRRPNSRATGESLFNDGTISFQGWLSCASCHGPESRMDALNWDLLNDGIGNPGNVKSLLLAHRTPPSMSHGVRANAEAAVRAGLTHILFADRPETEASAIDEYLKSLKPVPSPYLVNGKPSAAAKRGKTLFLDRTVGCAACHPAPLYTTLKSYDVGSGSIDTPTLVEVWRTAPYMREGSAATLREVLTTANPGDKHGKTSHLTPAQVDDLLAYLLTL